MIYAAHRTKGAPMIGALPGQHGPFGHRPAPDEDDTDLDARKTAAAVPAPTDGSER